MTKILSNSNFHKYQNRYKIEELNAKTICFIQKSSPKNCFHPKINQVKSIFCPSTIHAAPSGNVGCGEQTIGGISRRLGFWKGFSCRYP